MKNFWETKIRQIFLRGLKQKVKIFIGIKNTFNSINNNNI